MSSQRITRETLLPLVDPHKQYYLVTVSGGYAKCVIHDVGEKYLFFTCHQSKDKAIQMVMIPCIVSISWREEVIHRLPIDDR